MIIFWKSGGVVVGLENGSKCWNADMVGTKLSGVSWSPDSKFMFLLEYSGKIVAYDCKGEKIVRGTTYYT